MTFIEQLSDVEVLKMAKKFKKQYGFEPYIGFLVGYFKTTSQTIHRKLKELEDDGKILRIRKNKNITSYIII
jgi:hypothetical protein